jgi:hypothetical protein
MPINIGGISVNYDEKDEAEPLEMDEVEEEAEESIDDEMHIEWAGFI